MRSRPWRGTCTCYYTCCAFSNSINAGGPDDPGRNGAHACGGAEYSEGLTRLLDRMRYRPQRWAPSMMGRESLGGLIPRRYRGNVGLFINAVSKAFLQIPRRSDSVSR